MSHLTLSESPCLFFSSFIFPRLSSLSEFLNTAPLIVWRIRPAHTFMPKVSVQVLQPRWQPTPRTEQEARPSYVRVYEEDATRYIASEIDLGFLSSRVLKHYIHTEIHWQKTCTKITRQRQPVDFSKPHGDCWTLALADS